jgi:polyphosphate glucokinase
MHILSIDIGGSHLKASVLDADGTMLTERASIDTPHPCTPDVLVNTLVKLVQAQPSYDGVSVGFPGVVRHGVIITAPNLGTEQLKGFDLGAVLAQQLSKPVKIVNDADMQGLAAISGKGMEVVITLGTGFGSAIFSDGVLGPHLELSQHPFRKDETYDEQLGNAALEKIGKKKWNHRVADALETVRRLTNLDHLYIGGGNATKINFPLPPDVNTIPNEDGIRGGAWLWRERG